MVGSTGGERAEEPDEREGAAARVVAGREGQQSRGLEDRGTARGEGGFVEERAGSAGRRRRRRRVKAGVVSRLRPPSGERLLANYL